jgi:hypothetical protein
MIHLAFQLKSGQRPLDSLTLDECVAFIDHFGGDDCNRGLKEDICGPYPWMPLPPLAEMLRIARNTVRVELSALEDNEEYWAAYGDRYDDHLNIIPID